MSELIKHTSFTVEAGQKPVADRVGKRGGRPLRPWQGRGFEELSGKALRMLLAPTGSGKSTLIKALGVDDLERDPGLRVVVAVPQSMIARSFGDDTLELGKRTLHWSVAEGNDLTTTTARTVAALIRFLSAKPAKDPAGRVIVCTHQTLVMAHKKLMADRNGRKSPWARVALFIDEAHHSQADEDDAEKTNNQIGKLVKHWLDASPGPLLLATATWLRGNLLDIIPQNRAEDFTRFTYSMEEHLRSMVHLKQVSFRFLIGKPEEAIRALYADSHQKTIAWLPPVQSRHIRGTGTSKIETLERYQCAVGKPGRTDGWTTFLKTKSGRVVRSLDFVTPDGRVDRKARLDAAIEAGGDTPDLLWVLGLGKEGFDWPELSRGVVIGDRGSIVDVLQMMGRVLRDHPGKATAEFIIVLPWDGKADVDVEIVKGYIQTVIAAMVVEWQFKQTMIRRRTSESICDDPAKAAKVLSDVVDVAIRDQHAEERHRDIIRDALKKNGIHDDDEAIDTVCSLLSSSGRAVARQADGLPDAVKVEEGIFGGLRGLVARLGYDSLAAFREQLHCRVAPVSEETIRARIGTLSKHAYDKRRHTWGPGHVSSASMTRVYGKTFKEIRDGARFGDHVPEHVMRDAIQGLTKDEYDLRRTSLGPLYHNSGAFRAIYGKTFSELRDGVPHDDRVSADEIAAFIQGMSISQYNIARKSMGRRYPSFAAFQMVYGKTFAELRDGARGDSSYNNVVDENSLRDAIRGMSVDDYKRARHGLGAGFPVPNEFRRHYGKTFAELRDGASRADPVPEHDLAARIRGMTRKEYDVHRLSWGLGYVSGDNVRRVYGKSFTEIRDGIAKGDYVTADELRGIIKGMSFRDYELWRSTRGPGYPAPSKFSHIYGVTFKALRDGLGRSEFVSMPDFVMATRGMSISQYERLRSTLGPGFPSRSALVRVYGCTYKMIHAGRADAAE